MLERPRPSAAFVYYRGSGDGRDSQEVTALKAFRDYSDMVLDLKPIDIPYGRGELRGNVTGAIHDIKRQKEIGMLPLIVTPSARYTERGLQDPEGIAEVRTAVGREVPLLVIDPLRSEDLVDRGNNIYFANPQSQTMLELVTTLRASSPGLPQALRIYSADEARNILTARRTAFQDDGLDNNTSLVLGYLRWNSRYLNPEIVQDEFDQTATIPLVEEIDRSVYMQDLQTIRSMTLQERKQLEIKVNKLRSIDDYMTICYGFAIDAASLATEKAYGFGQHGKALVNLQQLHEYNRNFLAKKNISLPPARIVRGIQWFPFDPFETPILVLNLKDSENVTQDEMRRIGTHLINQGEAIPVTPDIRVIDNDFEYLPSDVREWKSTITGKSTTA